MSRSRLLRLRDGSTLVTPVLIPSVSSKGVGTRSDGFSEATTYLQLAANTAPEALLVSAYDIHHRLLEDVDRWLGGEIWDTAFAAATLLVLDSGGFELSTGWDAGELYRGEHTPKAFSAEDHELLLQQLSPKQNCLVVTYDHGAGESRSLEQQAAEAQRLRSQHPAFMVDALLKPPPGSFLDIEAIHAVATELQGVDVVGMTEAELGDSMLDRGRAIHLLRSTLDEAGIDAPIHVFGVLDPLLVSFYFSAGAEIFDGLTWTRYATHSGLSIYRDASALLAGRVELGTLLREATAQLEFLNGLRDLKRSLREFASSGDFSIFGPNAQVLADAHARLARSAEMERHGR